VELPVGTVVVRQRLFMREFHPAPWWRRFFQSPPAEGSLAWGEFMLKFGVAWPMFNWLLNESRRSGLFRDELREHRPMLPQGESKGESLHPWD